MELGCVCSAVSTLLSGDIGVLIQLVWTGEGCGSQMEHSFIGPFECGGSVSVKGGFEGLWF